MKYPVPPIQIHCVLSEADQQDYVSIMCWFEKCKHGTEENLLAKKVKGVKWIMLKNWLLKHELLNYLSSGVQPYLDHYFLPFWLFKKKYH